MPNMYTNRIRLSGMSREPRAGRLARFALTCVLAGMWLPASAQPEFNLEFLKGNIQKESLSALSTPGAVLPGSYLFTVYVNGQEVGREHIDIRQSFGQATIPCLHREQLIAWDIVLPDDPQVGTSTDQCVDVPALVPESTVSYNGNQQRLDLSIPQRYLVLRPRGYVQPALRDQGINAAFLNYSLTGTHNHQNGYGNSDYYFASLMSGLNLGAWRLRQNAVVHKDNDREVHWRSQSISLERDLQPIRSRLKLGDTYSGNSVFDSVQFRGVQLASDDSMLPFSQQGYAPVVRGVAATNARVEIRQDNVLIYAINVAPGPFEIRDIVPNRMSGDLDVSVIEADGSVQRYSQAFSGVESMLRPGMWRYELSAGQLRNGNTDYRPRFALATVAHGLASNTTPYGGILVAEHYAAAGLGVVQSLGRFGSLALDVTTARTELANGETQRGNSYRFLYSKSLNDLGTEFRLVGHRYSTSGYYDFNDAAAERDRWRNGHYETTYRDPETRFDGTPDWSSALDRRVTSNRYYNKRSRLEVILNQRVTDKLSMYANFYKQNFWGSDDSERNIQIGLNGRVKSVSYGLFFRDTRSQYGYSDRMIGLTLSIPLGKSSSSGMSSSSSFTHSRESGNTLQTGVYGTALDDGRLGYGVNVGHSEGAGATGTANLDYLGSKGAVSAGVTASERYSQFGWGVRGGVVAHGGGITLSQPLQRTSVLVHAPDGEGVGVENQPGVRLDANGYAVVSGLSPYRFNRVALRTDDLGAGIEASKVAARVVPTEGALTLVEFDARRGASVMIRSRREDGSMVPIGATAYNTQGQVRGVAGPNGKIFVSGVKPGEQLLVKWGQDAGQQCTLDTKEIPVGDLEPAKAGYARVALNCHSLS
ncbi:fimbrial biogenesis outer membrane usher protein [Allopusillimonas soli]|uniref:Fimbrial biogenesis outer membrane usher protein n=1 Tax=Allopusillimonas soli TaxID=659016 RepID=A0A853FCP4_9BURK|nr:fimbria/pilus outer membrane usher protein [Allopusillimonas soli]NYT37717.1 fimbrial biogenesis outer membrane usher protein [Allopusillimonas soli]TEA74337.1 fimbrial biogenesis outer membrane usher protein [Allopusillimonas soli]